MAKSYFALPVFHYLVTHVKFFSAIIAIFILSVILAILVEMAIVKFGFIRVDGSVTVELEITIFTVLLSSVIAFLAVIEWNASERVYANLVEETSYLRSILNKSRRFTDSPKDSELRKNVLEYVNSVINDDYSYLGAHGCSDPNTIKVYKNFVNTINSIIPEDAIQTEYLAQIIDDVGEVALRRNRIIQYSVEDVPREVWYILIPASIISVAGVFISQSNAYIRIFTSSVYSFLTFGMLLFIIYIQYPFTGDISVSERPFVFLRDDIIANRI